MTVTDADVARLVDAATAARTHAYAPYSVHHVGASVLTLDGSVFAGANMETVTLQASVHAERSAVVAMANAGHRRLRAVCVVGPYSGIPCSECRQTVWEFCGADPDVVVVSAPTDGPLELLTMGAIAPFPYGPETKGIDPTQH
ncbi:cytidine deaminase [Nocardioides hwasunensis]|uniref:Cytidine deaminase n=1 Tax=Nocardioides hwasunensis TaxID=397258 RepID=A0ABR8MMG3_9ACTN|nr:cytidine deaminase [Nocardioides hwasunensis]MBD3916456.1 cytidine deaminase [Nocardioides hwasunensis]